MCGGISLLSLFAMTLAVGAVYAITTFGPKLSLQNKRKKMLLYCRILPA